MLERAAIETLSEEGLRRLGALDVTLTLRGEGFRELFCRTRRERCAALLQLVDNGGVELGGAAAVVEIARDKNLRLFIMTRLLLIEALGKECGLVEAAHPRYL